MATGSGCSTRCASAFGWRAGDGGTMSNALNTPVPACDREDDRALVMASKLGDAQAFATLVKRHQAKIFALAMRYTGVREDAEDVVQQALQKAFLHLPRFQ